VEEGKICGALSGKGKTAKQSRRHKGIGAS
jgi:hypothetical protein